VTKRYLSNQGIGYFAFAFLFLRSFSTGNSGRPFFSVERMPNGIPFLSLSLPPDIYLLLAITSLLLSIAFGFAFFFPVFRNPSLRAESIISLIFTPAAFFSFLATWFDNRSVLAGVGSLWRELFAYVFLFWLAFLLGSFAFDLYRLRKKL